MTIFFSLSKMTLMTYSLQHLIGKVPAYSWLRNMTALGITASSRITLSRLVSKILQQIKNDSQHFFKKKYLDNMPRPSSLRTNSETVLKMVPMEAFTPFHD